MDSIWRQVQLPDFETLSGDAQTDVLIVGGGLAGVLCGYFLTQVGVPNLIIEAGRVAGGVTGCTTAKLTAQHGLKYEKLLRKSGLEKAELYLHSQQAALEAYRLLCRNLACDFQKQDAYVYTRDSLTKIEREISALEKLHVPVEFVQNLPLPFEVAGAVKFPDQAQFHPMKFLAGILPGLNIREHTSLKELAPGRAVTDRGEIRAEKIIMATHFPILNKHGLYFLKQYQSRSYVLALEPGPDVGGMYLDAAEGGLSFRNAGGCLLLGGGDHRTGKQGEAGGSWKSGQGNFIHRRESPPAGLPRTA